MTRLCTAARGTWRAGALVACAAVLGACSTTPAPPPPPVLEPPLATVLVLPVADDVERGPVHELLATIGAPLREHGYGMVPVPAGLDWLRDASLYGANPANPDLCAWARAHGIDALLAIRIVRWDAYWLRGLRTLDARILYHLIATDGRGVVWERDSESAYEFGDGWVGPGFYGSRHGSGFGMGFGSGYERDPPYGTPLEVCQRIHKNVVAHMPTGALARSP